MNVARVHDATGDHIEPPLDETWDNLTKLQWNAAVITNDTGLTIKVEDGAMRDDNGKALPGWFGLSIGRTGAAAFDFHSAWTYLNGVATGAHETKRADQEGRPS